MCVCLYIVSLFLSLSYTYFFYSIAKSTEKPTDAVSSRANRAALRQGVDVAEKESIPVAIPHRSTRARATKSAPVSKAAPKAATKAAMKAATKAPKASRAPLKAPKAPPKEPPKPIRKSSRNKN